MDQLNDIEIQQVVRGFCDALLDKGEVAAAAYLASLEIEIKDEVDFEEWRERIHKELHKRGYMLIDKEDGIDDE